MGPGVSPESQELVVSTWYLSPKWIVTSVSILSVPSDLSLFSFLLAASLAAPVASLVLLN